MSKRKAFVIAYWAVVALAALIIVNIIGKMGFSWIIMGLIVGAGAGISIYKSFKDEGYIKSTLAINKSNRILSFDYLRCLAVIFVIGLHTLQVDNGLHPELEGTALYSVFRYLGLFFIACNLLYVMISGGLLLPYKEESLSHFYLKRLTKIIIPLVVYYLFCLWQAEQFKVLTAREIFLKILRADTPEAPQLWMIYTIISVYLAIPFIRYMLKDMPYKFVAAFVVINLIFITIARVWPGLIGFSMPLAGWLGIAIAGYFMTMDETRKYDNVIIILGIIAAVGTGFVIRLVPTYQIILGNTSPFPALTSMAFFAIAFKFKDKLKDLYVIRLISKYSYGIILLHWWSLNAVTRLHFNLSAFDFYGFGALISAVVTLAVSLVAAYLIDNLCVVISELLYKIFHL